MILYVNDRNEIKDVHSTNDTSLKEVFVHDEENPFKDWSIAKICCYRVDVHEGFVRMFTPYVNSLIIEHLDRLGEQNKENAEGVEINSGGLFDVADVVDQNNTAIFELADFIADLMARVETLEGGE